MQTPSTKWFTVFTQNNDLPTISCSDIGPMLRTFRFTSTVVDGPIERVDSYIVQLDILESPASHSGPRNAGLVFRTYVHFCRILSGLVSVQVTFVTHFFECFGPKFRSGVRNFWFQRPDQTLVQQFHDVVQFFYRPRSREIMYLVASVRLSVRPSLRPSVRLSIPGVCLCVELSCVSSYRADAVNQLIMLYRQLMVFCFFFNKICPCRWQFYTKNVMENMLHSHMGYRIWIHSRKKWLILDRKLDICRYQINISMGIVFLENLPPNPGLRRRSYPFSSWSSNWVVFRATSILTALLLPGPVYMK